LWGLHFQYSPVFRVGENVLVGFDIACDMTFPTVESQDWVNLLSGLVDQHKKSQKLIKMLAKPAI